MPATASTPPSRPRARATATTAKPLATHADSCNAIVERVGQCFVGKRAVVKKLLAGALSGGHVLFEDYPGLGKPTADGLRRLATEVSTDR